MFPVLSLAKLVFKCVDDVFDHVAERLANNFLDNSDIIEQNRSARLQSQPLSRPATPTAQRQRAFTPAAFMA